MNLDKIKLDLVKLIKRKKILLLPVYKGYKPYDMNRC